MGKKRKDKKAAAKLTKDTFAKMVAELDQTRRIIEKAFYRLLNLVWPGALSTSTMVEPPPFENSVQRITEGLDPDAFCEQIMNILFRFVWEICKALEDHYNVLYQKSVTLQPFSRPEDMKDVDIHDMHANMDIVNFACHVLRDLKANLESKFKLSPFQQQLLDDAGENLEFGPFARKCIDLALHRDPRMFLSVESTRVFLEALQVAAMRSKLAEFRNEVQESFARVTQLREEYSQAYEQYASYDD